MNDAILNIDNLLFFEIIYYYCENKIIDQMNPTLKESFLILVWSFLRSIFWIAWNTVFGIVPVIVLYKIKFLGSPNVGLMKLLYENSISEKVIEEGIILFLCSALMGEITIECFYAKIDFGKFIYGLILVLTAFITYINSLLFEWVAFGQTQCKELIPYFTYIQWVIVVFSGVFCLIFKMWMLKSEELKELELNELRRVSLK